MKLFYLIIFSSFISYLSCNFSPGSYPNAELYELDTKESNLIEAIKDFKNEFTEGVEGKQTWLPIIHSKLNKNIVYGKNMYWIFGGMPGKLLPLIIVM